MAVSTNLAGALSSASCAWSYVALTGPELLEQHGETRRFRLVSRPASAAPSTGSSKAHAAEQAELVERAFAR